MSSTVGEIMTNDVLTVEPSDTIGETAQKMVERGVSSAVVSDYGTLGLFDDAYAGNLKLLWVLGQNPLVTNPNLNYLREAFAKLEMLVVQELWETEIAAFWQAPIMLVP